MMTRASSARTIKIIDENELPIFVKHGILPDLKWRFVRSFILLKTYTAFLNFTNAKGKVTRLSKSLRPGGSGCYVGLLHQFYYQDNFTHKKLARPGVILAPFCRYLFNWFFLRFGGE